MYSESPKLWDRGHRAGPQVPGGAAPEALLQGGVGVGVMQVGGVGVLLQGGDKGVGVA